jgi:cob(I)alamin adenosyltransferase
MVKINKIYTKTGDAGETHLVGGRRVLKSSKRIAVSGEVDELNCFIGWSYGLALKTSSTNISEALLPIQSELFDLGAYTASVPGDQYAVPLKLTESDITRIENTIDSMIDNLPVLKSFILPGGNELMSALHITRAVCRRAERSLVSLMQEESIEKLALKYLNRLSDLLFAMTRYESNRSGSEEILWKPRS